MEIGILGLPQSGKSTLFEIMTGLKSRDVRGESCVRGQATVPDPRFDHLVSTYKLPNAFPARVPFIDVNAVGEKAWEAVRQNLSSAEGLLHIVDGFSVSTVQEAIQAYRKLGDELILSDLLIIENRMNRLAKMSKSAMKPPDVLQWNLLPRLKEHLEGGLPLRDLHLGAEEFFSLRSFSFWTIRPELVVVNVGEDNLSFADAFEEKIAIPSPIMGICCQIEAELAGLTVAEQKEFLSSMGIEEPAFGRIIRAAFTLLGRISFFTIGDTEIKAWVIPTGTKAPKAASVIHKDFERGFIKAEVVAYDDFVACGSSIPKAKTVGKLRLEGKEYIVRDGDIITFRFNV